MAKRCERLMWALWVVGEGRVKYSRSGRIDSDGLEGNKNGHLRVALPGMPYSCGV